MNFRKIKSLISTVIVSSMLVAVVPAAFASDVHSKYIDFPTGWSQEAMEHAVDNGILHGRSSNTINPTDKLTRAEMATIINRVFGAKIKADITKYTDVSSSDWYYEEISKAVNMRTFIGDSATTINPDENITREAVFTVVARALVLETEDYSSLNKFPDANKVSDWAKSASAVLVSKGYIHGNDEGLLCPQCPITRQEFAQMMYNIIKTYYITEGEYSHTGEQSSLIRTSGVTLKNVTIDGDLILGDGVGYGTVTLENVIINGRLLCRGGEKAVKLINTKVGEYVVVYDVNGTVHFENYRTEEVFNNIKELTPATFLTASSISGTGNYNPGGSTPTYYTVSFHNGSSLEVFDSVSIDTSYVDANRTLAYAGKDLDVIYSDYTTTLPAYNRSSLAPTALNTEYEHQVDKEYIYEEAPGVWSVFTENTTVSKNIDVYYAAKRLASEIDLSFVSMPYTLEVRYDSKSRFADSLKDTLIDMGSTLQQNEVKKEINSKITGLYNRLNNETGMVDSKGNILDKDYGMKIIDVIDYDQIQAEVKKYIEGMLNGDTSDPEYTNNLKAIVSLFDVPTILEQLGGNEFIVKLLDNDDFKDTVIDILKTDDVKTKLLEILAKNQVKDEITKIVKGNDDFKNSIIDSADVRKALVSAVAEPGHAYVEGQTEGTDNNGRPVMSQNAQLIRSEVFSIVQTSYPDLYTVLQRKNVYEAIIEAYVTGDGYSDTFSNIYFDEDTWEEYTTMIDDVIASVVEKYFSTDANQQLSAELNGIIDSAVIDFAEKYLNGDKIIENNNTVNAKFNEIIENTIISFIKLYFEGKTSLSNDADIKNFADSIINAVDADVIVDYITGLDEVARKKLAQEIVELLKSYPPYIEFMEAFKNKEDTFEINKSNTHFVTAVGQAIYGFDFDEILQILKKKGFGPAISFLGEDVLAGIFETSQKNYWNGLEPIVQEVVDSSDENIKRSYTTKMSITINVPSILHGIYNKYADNFVAKIENNDIYDYNDNKDLQKFVNLDWFSLFVGYDENRKNEAEGITGYYFKDYMEYYCSVLDVLIIFDDALCFYSDTEKYDDEEFIQIKKSLTQDIIAFLEELQSLSDKIENNDAIVKSYTLQDIINKVDSLNDAVDSIGGTELDSQSSNIKAAIDNIKGILEGLGQGELPNGYTLEDLNVLCAKLETVINSMNENKYEEVNDTFNELISKAMNRLDTIITELDEEGTISGTPIEEIASKISVLNTIYNKYTTQIKDMISALADVDLDSTDISLDCEKFVNIIFGREGDDNIFNIDSAIDLIKDKLGAVEKQGYNENLGVYIIDQYSKTYGENKVTIQRLFY